jgi:hypothetical protein
MRRLVLYFGVVFCFLLVSDVMVRAADASPGAPAAIANDPSVNT